MGTVEANSSSNITTVAVIVLSSRHRGITLAEKDTVRISLFRRLLHILIRLVLDKFIKDLGRFNKSHHGLQGGKKGLQINNKLNQSHFQHHNKKAIANFPNNVGKRDGKRRNRLLCHHRSKKAIVKINGLNSSEKSAGKKPKLFRCHHHR